MIHLNALRIIANFVMLETKPVNANLVYDKTLTLLEIWQIQSQHQVECFVYFQWHPRIDGSVTQQQAVVMSLDIGLRME